ncbi:MAG: ParB/Srx family N-terminal domain-containing protein [Pseudomonadota bacterium]
MNGTPARTLPNKINQIAASIRRFGFTNPVLLDGEGTILAGHGRAAAAKRLGMQEVPTLRLDHLNAAERRAYVLADNKIAANAGWDAELLRLELGALAAEPDLDFDVEITGFETPEIDLILVRVRRPSKKRNPPRRRRIRRPP